MSDLLPRFKARWEQALAEFDKQEFGRFAPFIKLKADCAKEGFQPCSSQACTRKVLKLSEFNADGKGRKLTRCTHCHHGAGAMAASEASKQAGKRQAEAVAEAGPKFSAIQVENDAREYLSAMLAALSDEAKRLLLAATPEFRTADAGARPLASEDDAWLPIQIKADGPYHDDGKKTPKPNDTSQHGGAAQFGHCANEGYAGMLMVFVKTRLNKEGNLVRTIWAIPWRADMKDHQAENESNHLGQKNLNITPLSDVGVLADLILSQPASLA